MLKIILNTKINVKCFGSMNKVLYICTIKTKQLNVMKNKVVIRKQTKKRLKALLKMVEIDALEKLEKILNSYDVITCPDFVKDNDLLAGQLIVNKSRDFELSTPEYVEQAKRIDNLYSII